MIRYAKVINEETGLCDVGLGTNIDFYKSIGMEELDVEQSEKDNLWYLSEKCPHYTPEEKAAQRQADFEKAFFNTSLGYVRRSVTMADGSHKDFLSDLLPVISMGVQAGQAVNILTYDEPPFDHDIEDWTEYQHQVIVTAEFIQECFRQLSNDFLPINDKEG
jgi:hypothetical protein